MYVGFESHNWCTSILSYKRCCCNNCSWYWKWLCYSLHRIHRHHNSAGQLILHQVWRRPSNHHHQQNQSFVLRCGSVYCNRVAKCLHLHQPFSFINEKKEMVPRSIHRQRLSSVQSKSWLLWWTYYRLQCWTCSVWSESERSQQVRWSMDQDL